MNQREIHQKIEMIEIYRDTEFGKLNPEEINLAKEDLKDSKQQLEEELAILYQNGTSPIDDPQMNKMEMAVQEIDTLLEDISYYEVPTNSTKGTKKSRSKDSTANFFIKQIKLGEPPTEEYIQKAKETIEDRKNKISTLAQAVRIGSHSAEKLINEIIGN